MTRDEWRKTIAHDHGNPSRAAAFTAIGEFLGGEAKEFVEIGFCSCFDFETQFKKWHDGGLIFYIGYDTCKQFALYALAEFPGYHFRYGGPIEMDGCDISYARHVFMTMAPELMEPTLRAMLKATKQVCVVTWHYPPQDDKGHHLRHQEGERDVWTNRYGYDQVMAIYESEGFAVEMRPAGKEVLYLARREHR